MLKPPLLLVGQLPLEMIRRSKGAYVKGRWVEGAEETVTITANVQPVEKSSDTRILPEAIRSHATLKVYSPDPIREMKQGDQGWDADRFYWEGELYEVMKTINYKMGVLNHYKALCKRVELT